jgi:hypothetical protein
MVEDMKNFKGTPGPWEARLMHGDINVIRLGSLRNEGVKAISYQLVAHAIDDADDANLIAASTELLSALQHLVEVYDDPTGKQWTTTSKREALDKAREAINLALGE